ncbi:hypothetical protein NDU88_000451 [Pleurodeles waltl]|uniref:Uncharacterized protein n=1 Tax=Pleurodeles waltl TaxID=8319 RepID=A0AAV7NG51_PLEWA|nr:hypothetical protein NDU88_000451 [Pleurodeles waltl]
MGNRTLRDLCWDLRHFLVSIHLENLAVKRSLLQALRHSPPAGQLLNRHPEAPPSRTKTHSGSPDAPLLWQQRWSQRSSRLSRFITSHFRACALAPSPSLHLQAHVRPWVVSPAAHEAPFPVITRKNAQEKRATGNHKNERNSEYKQWSKEYRSHQELKFNF